MAASHERVQRDAESSLVSLVSFSACELDADAPYYGRRVSGRWWTAGSRESRDIPGQPDDGTGPPCPRSSLWQTTDVVGRRRIALLSSQGPG